MKHTILVRHSLALSTLAILSACALTQPTPAPVTSGNGSAATGTSAPVSQDNPYGTTQNNPYGAAPYTPASNTQSTTPYTPAPAAAPSTAGSTSTGYVPSYAPVDINAATHTVVRGDTVYNISRRYQISQDNLRAWNNLTDNNIHTGQVLRVKPAGYQAPATSSVAQAPAPAPTPTHTTTVSGATRTVAGITWQRPTAGSIITNFGGSNKGINIAGNAGQPVVASADGKVVYSGSGLRGYGNLIIVQHNQTYLTAYGHNQRLLVREGQTVRRGQTIATMGSSDASRNQLHFELRENGQPVDPTRFIPN